MIAIIELGSESGAALATVVGVLIEMPAMLVVKVVTASKGWYEAGSRASVNASLQYRSVNSAMLDQARDLGPSTTRRMSLSRLKTRFP